MIRILSAAALALAATAALTPAAAQTATCHPADSTSVTLLDYLKDQVLADSPEGVAARDSLGLPAIDTTQVVLVTSGTNCRKAADAYRANVSGPTARLSNSPYVFQLGTSFAVADPSYYYSTPSRSLLIMVFDSRWKLRSKFF